MLRTAPRSVATLPPAPLRESAGGIRVRSHIALLVEFGLFQLVTFESTSAEERLDRRSPRQSGGDWQSENGLRADPSEDESVESENSPPPPRIVRRRVNSPQRPRSTPPAVSRASADDTDSAGFSKLNLTGAEEPEEIPALDESPTPKSTPGSGRTPKALFNVDIDKLGDIPVKPSAPARNKDVPSSYVSTEDSSNRNAATTGELLEKAGSVNVRRTSAINLDALVRGYNSQQTIAVANGMNEMKTRVDIDSLFSQVDPGIVQNITVIDGPYSSLYGPGFAFLVADLQQGQRYEDGFQGHASSSMSYGANGGALYTRGNA